MASRDITRRLPLELWRRIFLICILDMRDWEKQPLTRASSVSRDRLWTEENGMSAIFLPGASEIALVSKSWYLTVANMVMLKAARLSIKIGGASIPCFERALECSSPHSIQLFVCDDQSHTRNHKLGCLNQIVSHSSRCHSLSVSVRASNSASVSQFLRTGDFNRLQYLRILLHWGASRCTVWNPTMTHLQVLSLKNLILVKKGCHDLLPCIEMLLSTCSRLSDLSLKSFSENFEPWILRDNQHYRQAFRLSQLKRLYLSGSFATIIFLIRKFIAPQLEYVEIEGLYDREEDSDVPTFDDSMFAGHFFIFPKTKELSLYPLDVNGARFLSIYKASGLHKLVCSIPHFLPEPLDLHPKAEQAYVFFPNVKEVCIRDRAIYGNWLLRRLGSCGASLSGLTLQLEFVNRVLFHRVPCSLLIDLRTLSVSGSELEVQGSGSSFSRGNIEGLSLLLNMYYTMSSDDTDFYAADLDVTIAYPRVDRADLFPRLRSLAVYAQVGVDRNGPQNSKCDALTHYMIWKSDSGSGLQTVMVNFPVRGLKHDLWDRYVERVDTDYGDLHHPWRITPRNEGRVPF